MFLQFLNMAARLLYIAFMKLFKLYVKILFAFLFISFSLLSQAFAWPPTYGAEFEFSHPSITLEWDHGGNEQAGEAKLIYVKNIIKLCQSLGCKVEAVQGKWQYLSKKDIASDYKVTLADGWWFKVSHDPECVEITTKPSTQEELKKREKSLTDIIFNSGTSLGFKVPEGDTAHFNIGFKSAFDGDGDAFLRFYVDYQNRPELSLGALGHDVNNGPPLAILTEPQREALAKLVDEQKTHHYDARTLAAKITSLVYTRSYDLSWGGAGHYQAIGLKYIAHSSEYALASNDKPFELRAIWAQHNMGDFIKLAQLFEARIAYLKTLKTPIVYSKTSRTKFSNTEKVTRFYIYVTECGLKFEDYKSLLAPELQNVRLDAFLNPSASPKWRFRSLLRYADITAESPVLRQYRRDVGLEAIRFQRAAATPAQDKPTWQKVRELITGVRAPVIEAPIVECPDLFN